MLDSGVCWPWKAPTLIIIHNPTAGRRNARRLRTMLAALTEQSATPEVRTTTRPGDATAIAAAAVREGARCVIAAGGDGTAAEVAQAIRGSATALGILPLGSANVLAREIGLPFAPAALAATLIRGHTRVHWPGEAATGGQTRLFLQMCGVGFDAHVVATLSLARKRRLGRLAYGLRSLGALADYPFRPIPLLIDGQPHTAASAVISKGRLYAGPFTLCPSAVPTRPGFQVALFGHTGRAAVLGHGAALLANRLPQLRSLNWRAASEILVPEAGLAVQADGDALGTTPLRITNAAEPIRIIAPGS